MAKIFQPLEGRRMPILKDSLVWLGFLQVTDLYTIADVGTENANYS